MLDPRAAFPNRIDRLLATFFGSGCSPILPGTAGTALAAAPLFFLPNSVYPYALGLGCVLATLGSVHLARKLPKKSEGGDPGWFVLDEAAGFWLAAFATAQPTALHLVIAFVSFRIFDMTKPPPLRRLERVRGGWGIVLDDLGAGALALALTFALVSLLIDGGSFASEM